MDFKSINDLADRFFRAIENDDIGVVEKIYHPAMVIWHNFDNAEQSRADNLAFVASFAALFTELRYTGIRRRFFEGGCVQQHVLTGYTKASIPFAISACMLIYIQDEMIIRIDEYLDTAQLPSS